MTTHFRYTLPAIFLMAGFLLSCKNEIEEINALTEDVDLAVQTSYNAEYDYTEEGKIVNRLKAKQLDRYIGEDPRLEATGGFEMIMFDTLEQAEAFLTAEKGIYYEKQNILKAEYNVLLTNSIGDSLETQELIWLQDSGKIYTEKEVIISTRDGKLFGKGLVSDERFTTYTINDIHGSLNIDEPIDTNVRETN